MNNNKSNFNQLIRVRVLLLLLLYFLLIIYFIIILLLHYYNFFFSSMLSDHLCQKYNKISPLIIIPR